MALIENIWEEDIHVLSFHMDPKGSAHLASICNYLQEGASMHAENAGFGYEAMIRRNQIWILSRLKIEINSYPVWKQSIKLLTWSRGKEGIFYIRDFIIEDEKQKPMIKATSSWAAINLKTRRPEIVDSLEEGFVSNKEKIVFQEKLGKLPTLIRPKLLRKRQIEYTDIDLIYHVNNVKYIEMIMNSYSLKTHTRKRVQSLEINYLGEVKYGEQVLINEQQNQENENITFINIVRESDSKEVCRAKLEWV